MMDRTLIIAEAGVNHNGSLDLALELVKKAHECGADIVKFQTFKAGKLLTDKVEKAGYQKAATDQNESQYEMIKKLELSEEAHLILHWRCRELGIEFLSTPFDIDSLHFLVNDIGMERIKIPSGEVTNGPLLLEAARTGKAILLSTGMCTMGEIEAALSVLAYGYLGEEGGPSAERFAEAYASDEGQRLLKENVTLLHCTTEYPAPYDEVNLRVMHAFASAFGLRAGYSDHTAGIAVPVAAAALGATVIEKHFTLDRNLPGPDHASSLEPQEFKAMVESIRQVEVALGTPVKRPTPSEMLNKRVVRKTIVAAKPIRKGERIAAEHLAVKRAGNGPSPMEYWRLIGKTADKDYEIDQIINGFW